MLVSAPLLSGIDNDEEFPEDELERIERVNEGELVFLEQPPSKPVHHHHDRIRINPSSLEDGWVSLEQCHDHLDPVGSLEIVYHPQRIRKLSIDATRAIAESRVDGATVQLSGVSRGARICIQAESRALVILGEGRYRLKNGPYMRRFLDGYYPMRVSMEILYPEGLLEPVDYRPNPGNSGHVQTKSNPILWQGWFEGRLFTEFDFAAKER